MTEPAAAFSVGDSLEAGQVVTPERTAIHIGSGALRVFATPSMALLVERTCRDLMEPGLPPGQTSVGVEIRVRHLAPTPLGGKVRIRVEITGIHGQTVDFKAEIWDEAELVGLVEHRRCVIDSERFLRRVRKKADQVPSREGEPGDPSAGED
ncbi:MAG TPA: thioesterase family protein [Anaerolineales bacterium]|nr:thioesterase family protein [Anaerolineales bacterium]